MLDGSAPFYEVYETADGGFMAVGAIEQQFYAELVKGLELDPATLPKQMDMKSWPEMKRRFTDLFKTRTRAEWTEVFEGVDACVSPVLSLAEAAAHPHNIARRTFVAPEGVLQAGVAPRFSRTPAGDIFPPPRPGEHSDTVLAEYGFNPDEIAALRKSGAVT